jgi:uncharacterized protein YndB with AHSA1/START domain
MSDDTDMRLRIERLIPVQPERLFALWIEPAQLVKWWAPEGYEASVDVLDGRSGGRWRVTMRRADGGEIAASGVYRIIEPPHRLSFSWAWDDASGARGHETEVTVTFEPTPGGTRLVLVQQHFESTQARDDHDRGWSASFDRMRKIAG